MKKLMVSAAGSQPQNSDNPNAASQYDVACSRSASTEGA
jgi:hypothetical protein